MLAVSAAAVKPAAVKAPGETASPETASPETASPETATTPPTAAPAPTPTPIRVTVGVIGIVIRVIRVGRRITIARVGGRIVDRVAAGAVVSPGTQVPRGSLLMGAPARVKRQVTEKDLELIYNSAKNYVALAAEYRAAQDR